MAEGNSHTISEYSKERTNDRCVIEKQISKDEHMNESFTVQNYRDYNVYSDVENVLNLNPVNYIDHVKPVTYADLNDDTQSFNNEEPQETPTKSLIANLERLKPSSVSAIVKTAAHIIGPPSPIKPSKPVRRRERKDDSVKNYNETVALNEEVIDLFGDKKIDDASSVSNTRFNQFTIDDVFSRINVS